MTNYGMRTTQHWRYGVNLACPHETAIELGVADSFEAAWDFNHSVPMQKDGLWPRAQRCDSCGRVRRVKSLFISLVTA